MKPVPIMQYLDHFGRVGQTEAQPFASGPAPAPFKPRTLRAVPEPPARASFPLSRALREIGAPRDESAPAPRPRPRVAPSDAEIEARIAEAYERGCREGAAAAAGRGGRKYRARGRWRARAGDACAARLPAQRIRPSRRNHFSRVAGNRTPGR